MLDCCVKMWSLGGCALAIPGLKPGVIDSWLLPVVGVADAAVSAADVGDSAVVGVVTNNLLSPAVVGVVTNNLLSPAVVGVVTNNLLSPAVVGVVTNNLLSPTTEARILNALAL